MERDLIYRLLVVCVLMLTATAHAQTQPATRPAPIILDMVHNNPGHPECATLYKDVTYQDQPGVGAMVEAMRQSVAATEP
jgi:hypothetical protein